ncbi:helix-turn-helix domain-containing protein [Nonomuraea bangladeshensis]|uniref:helix-turn-helix domain-containing protein n=1 Tax=Nonomuraea bangladeshensis TaxID=404385 RepID=UPI003C305824
MHDETGDEIFYDEPPYRQVPDAVTFHEELKDVDVRLFIAFAWFARGGRGAFPGRKALAKKIHKKSLRTIDEAINRLVAAGFLTVTARYHDNGGRRSNMYRLYREPLPEQLRQGRPGADVAKAADQTPEQKTAQGPQAENCAGAQAENCTTPEQKTAQENNETNEKRDEVEGNLAADAASVAQDASDDSTPAGQDGLPFDDMPAAATAATATKKTSGKRPQAPLTTAPERMDVTLAMHKWARDNGIRADLALETAQFLDHHRAKGSNFRDWPAAWRTWMRNTLKFAQQGGRASTPGNHLAPYDPTDAANEQNRKAWG